MSPESSLQLVQAHFAKCGYVGERIATDYPIADFRVPLVGFYGKPWDARSACLAAVPFCDDGRIAVDRCRSLGAPGVFACGRSHVEFWSMGVSGAQASQNIPLSELDDFFASRAEHLSPTSVYTSKIRGPSLRAEQMWFIDAGLLASVERRTGNDLRRLVEGAIQHLASRLGGRLRTRKNYDDLYKTVFWLLAAKILNEKRVENFRRINLNDVDDVFRRVGRHYADTEQLPPGGLAWRQAIDEVASQIAEWGHLGNTSAESLAYLYETALVDAKPVGRTRKAPSSPSLRKMLGIHSTPPPLIDHVLAQLWPLIEDIAPEDRNVFEPACGHAGFLVAAMRWLRDFSGIDDEVLRHRYLRERLHGIEVDAFARELAKLQLTLADVPHGNSWRIVGEDIFLPGVLERAAAECTILLANPPYESFTPRERERYRGLGSDVRTTKAAELLRRTLPQLPVGAVFGIVVPASTLHGQDLVTLRSSLLSQFQISEVAVFADNLFEHGDHEVAVILGRRKRAQVGHGSLIYRRVRENGMSAFKERLAFSWERVVDQERFLCTADADLRLRDLDDVWKHLSTRPKLGDIASVRQGVSLHTGLQHAIEQRKSRSRPSDAVPAIVASFRGVGIWELPKTTWLRSDRTDVLHWRGGTYFDRPQVLVNYASQSRSPWRLKAFFDPDGHAVNNKYIAVRPIVDGVSALALWALMNSPMANAFAYSGSLKRHTFDGLLKELPLPTRRAAEWTQVEASAQRYRTLLAADSFFNTEDRGDTIRAALLAMDAEVLRLYNLPPKLEHQLLGLFTSVERKGVGCRFDGYYQPGMESFIPLRELLSAEYARSTLEQFRRNDAAPAVDIIGALREADAAFGEE